jgi:hypothetical protein
VGGASGTASDPPAEADAEAGRVRVRWELQGRGVRQERHLYLTLHERHFVIASRIVKDAEPTGSTTLLVPEARRPTAVMASA